MTTPNPSDGELEACPWCSDPIHDDEPTVIVDGARLHLNCAAEEREDATFDRDMGFGDDR